MSVGLLLGLVSSARVLKSSKRLFVNVESGVFLLKLSLSDFKTKSVHPAILVRSPAKFARPVNGFGDLFLIPPPQEPVESVPPRSLKRFSVFLIVSSTACTISALIVGTVRSAPLTVRDKANSSPPNITLS